MALELLRTCKENSKFKPKTLEPTPVYLIGSGSHVTQRSWSERGPDKGSKTTNFVRAIGRWSLAALMVNIMVGSGIFGLPSKVASLTGRQSPIAFLIAAVGIAIVAACIAEVASRFRESGGPYLYTKVAFGRLVGLQTGWLNWLSRLASSAANANLFPDYLAEFWPRMREPVPRVVAITLLLAVLTAVNVRGVKMGTGVSNFLAASKLVPLIAFIAASLRIPSTKRKSGAYGSRVA